MKWCGQLGMAFILATSLFGNDLLAADKPELVIGTPGLGTILNDIKFMTERAGKSDSYFLLEDVLATPFEPGLDRHRPAQVQVPNVLHFDRMVTVVPLHAFTFYDTINAQLTGIPTDANEAAPEGSERLTGFDTFLKNLAGLDVQASEPQDGVLALSGAVESLARHLSSSARLALGSDAAALKGDVLDEQEVLKEANGDSIYLQWNGHAGSANDASDAFTKATANALANTQPFTDESAEAFAKRKASLEVGNTVLLEAYRTIGAARVGAAIDPTSGELLTNGFVEFRDGSEPSVALRAMQKRVSRFEGLQVPGAVTTMVSHVPLTASQSAYLLDTANYLATATEDVLNKGEITYEIVKTVDGKEAFSVLDPNAKGIKEKVSIKLILTPEGKKFLLHQTRVSQEVARQTAALGYSKAFFASTAGKATVGAVTLMDRAAMENLLTSDKALVVANPDGDQASLRLYDVAVPSQLNEEIPELYGTAKSMSTALVEHEREITLWYASGENAKDNLLKAVNQYRQQAAAPMKTVLQSRVTISPILNAIYRNLAKYGYPKSRTEREAFKLALAEFGRNPNTGFDQTMRAEGNRIVMKGKMDAETVAALGKILAFYVDDALQ